jgi:hypothetical protein
MKPIEIEREIAALQVMSTGQLCERYQELFGEPVRTRHKTYLVRKIAWKLQALAEGDLTERARRRAEELADDTEVRVMPPKAVPKPLKVRTDIKVVGDPRLPQPGTALVRKYKGRQVQVLVLSDGFEFNGEKYSSLSAVAKKITGTHCNGFRFFNLEKSR